jgi:hypothetical protein
LPNFNCQKNDTGHNSYVRQNRNGLSQVGRRGYGQGGGCRLADVHGNNSRPTAHRYERLNRSVPTNRNHLTRSGQVRLRQTGGFGVVRTT